MSTEVVNLVDELAELDREKTGIDKRMKEIKAELIERYKERVELDDIDPDDAKVFRGSNVIASVTHSFVNRFDTTSFKKEYAPLYESFQKESEQYSVRLKNS